MTSALLLVSSVLSGMVSKVSSRSSYAYLTSNKRIHSTMFMEYLYVLGCGDTVINKGKSLLSHSAAYGRDGGREGVRERERTQ